MANTNLTIIEEFILLGFSEYPNVQGFLFVVFLFIYISIVLGNCLIIIITNVDSALQTPMYYFLGNFSFVEMCYTSNILPRMLVNIWRQKRNISLLSCAVQLCFFLILVVTESFLLAVMAYDRYVAICKPLYYPIIMNHRICVQMVFAFSTCSYHVMVVCLFYGSGLIAYFQSMSSYSGNIDKFFSVFYTIVTPMINPMIYSLRNKDFIAAMKKFFSKWKG
uniref:G-protein coupled receptors family 1 profile domain-containing protein n=1 Tax=Monodelphis domestica TaxID=13616 RepID=F6V1E4_MONDO